MLPSNIDSFKSSIARRGGVARGNYFALSMNMPLLNLDTAQLGRNLLSGNTSLGQVFNDPRDLTFLCENTSLPGRNIMTNEYANVSKATKKPYGYTNDDVSFTFILTQDYFAKRMLEGWQSMVMNYETHRLRYKNDYVQDVTIQQLSKNGMPIYTIKLKNAYPVTINAVELNSGAENSVQKVTVTLAYDDWEEAAMFSSLLDAATSVIGALPGVGNKFQSLTNKIENLIS